MSTASLSDLVSLPTLKGTLDYPAIERERRVERIAEWVEKLEPTNPLEHWLVGRAASASLEIERLESVEAEQRQTVFIHAGYCWEADRQIEAEELGQKLHKKPGVISRKLRGFKQGAEWLLERWTSLRWTLDQGIDWSDAQRSLAFDLLGLAETERNGSTMVDLPPNLGPEHLIPMRLQIAKEQMDMITQSISISLKIVDDQERRQTILGHSPARRGSALAGIRREMTAAARQLRWALDTFYKVRNNYFAAVEPSNETKPITATAPTPIEEAPEQNEPNWEEEMPSAALLIGSKPDQTLGNRRSRRALASTFKRRRA